MRRARHVACTVTNIPGFQWENKKEDFDVDMQVILKWILEQQDAGYGLDLSGSEQRPVVDSYEHDEPQVP